MSKAMGWLGLLLWSTLLVACSGTGIDRTGLLPTPTEFPTRSASPTAPSTATATPLPPTRTSVVAPSPPPEPSATTALPTRTPSPTPTLAPTQPPAPTATAVLPTPVPPPSPTLIAPPEAPVAQPAGRYVFPIIAARYSYGPYHHDYPATDIFCPIGSQFVAPTAGIVDYVSREDLWRAATNDPATRGGLAVAIIGDDGVRYYGSHLSLVADGIEPGVRVAAGQLLGLTGKSGNAASTEPHIHFGISRPTTPDDWQVRRGELPPYVYLQAWEQGDMLPPVV